MPKLHVTKDGVMHYSVYPSVYVLTKPSAFQGPVLSASKTTVSSQLHVSVSVPLTSARSSPKGMHAHTTFTSSSSTRVLCNQLGSLSRAHRPKSGFDQHSITSLSNANFLRQDVQRKGLICAPSRALSVVNLHLL